MLNWPQKDPNEILSYGVNWASALDGDEIVASTLLVTSGSAVIDSSSFDNSTITATISGGIDGQTTVLTNTITTALGLVYEETINLPVRSSAFQAGPATTTKRAYVEVAFEIMAMSGYEFDATPEEQNSLLRRLDTLMARLLTEGLDLGYNFPAGIGQGDPDDPSGIPDGAFDGIAGELAQSWASSLGKSLSAEANATRAKAMTAARTFYTTIPNRCLTRATPRGSGRYGAVWRPFGGVWGRGSVNG